LSATAQATVNDQIMAKIRAVLALEGATGQAGEVAITLTNKAGSPQVFRSATVAVEGPYSVSMTTDESLFLALRNDGVLIVHVGPNTGTMARFHINLVDTFEYRLDARESRYAFAETRKDGQTKLTVSVRW
jgi:hypothetical protein